MADKKEKTVERVVRHPNFYMNVEGKLQAVAPGTTVTLTEAQAEKHAGKLTDVSTAKKLDENGAEVKADPAITETLQAMQAQIDALKAENRELVEAAAKKPAAKK